MKNKLESGKIIRNFLQKGESTIASKNLYIYISKYNSIYCTSTYYCNDTVLNCYEAKRHKETSYDLIIFTVDFDAPTSLYTRILHETIPETLPDTT